jgi:hypothetical protein
MVYEKSETGSAPSSVFVPALGSHAVKPNATIIKRLKFFNMRL